MLLLRWVVLNGAVVVVPHAFSKKSRRASRCASPGS